VGRATRGLILDYPHGVDESLLELDPIPLLSTLAFDSNGTQRLLSDDIVSLHFAHAAQERFANPDREYTGYAANGFWYTNGLPDPTHVPFQASWAAEGENDPTENRGDLVRMPPRLIIAATRREVAMFDADTLNLWMRFVIDVVTPPGQGAWAGKPSTHVREVRYSNGFLVAATNEGLRIADFRRDRGMLLGQSIVYEDAVDGLADRNSDTFFDGATSVSPDHLVQNTECLSLDMGAFSISVLEGGSLMQSRTIAAVGHPDGITAVHLDDPALPLVQTKRHPARLDVGNGWEIEDDLDLDNLSRFFVDDNFDATPWEALGARRGDTLITDTSLELLITRVEQIQAGRRLWVEPEVDITATGASYSVIKPVGAVLLSPDLHLYFANGIEGVAVVRDQQWITTEDFIFNSLNVASDRHARLAAPVDAINDFARRGDVLFAATSKGVFGASDEALDARRTATFFYSTEAVTDAEARYRILFGEEQNCPAISVDPETGNIMVAVTEFESIVTEINPNIHQAFRYFDNVGRIKALIAYRNPKGPPDGEAL
jgi:hypothetical protein